MSRRLLGPVGGPIAFVLVAGLVFAGLGWVTVAALRVEDAQRQAAAQAEVGKRLGKALWRLDLRVLPGLGAEDGRPYHHYTPADAASPYGPPCAPLLANDLQPWMRLHFQVDPAGGWESPQVLADTVAADLRLRWPALPLRNATPERATLLGVLRAKYPTRHAAELFAARERAVSPDTTPLTGDKVDLPRPDATPQTRPPESASLTDPAPVNFRKDNHPPAIAPAAVDAPADAVTAAGRKAWKDYADGYEQRKNARYATQQQEGAALPPAPPPAAVESAAAKAVKRAGDEPLGEHEARQQSLRRSFTELESARNNSYFNYPGYAPPLPAGPLAQNGTASLAASSPAPNAKSAGPYNYSAPAAGITGGPVTGPVAAAPTPVPPTVVAPAASSVALAMKPTAPPARGMTLSEQDRSPSKEASKPPAPPSSPPAADKLSMDRGRDFDPRTGTASGGGASGTSNPTAEKMHKQQSEFASNLQRVEDKTRGTFKALEDGKDAGRLRATADSPPAKSAATADAKKAADGVQRELQANLTPEPRTTGPGLGGGIGGFRGGFGAGGGAVPPTVPVAPAATPPGGAPTAAPAMPATAATPPGVMPVAPAALPAPQAPASGPVAAAPAAPGAGPIVTVADPKPAPAPPPMLEPALPPAADAERLGRGMTPAAPPMIPPVAVHLGSMRPQWLTAADGTELLVLARAARLEDRTVYQGVVLDWPRLQEVLRDEVKDLFPEAKLVPVKDPAGATPERAMTALPVQLDPGSAPTPPPAGWTTLRLGLVLAWVAAVVAFAAVGLAGWSLIDLSERRIRFVSAVTHELRTPLTALRLYLDLLLSGMVQDEQKRTEYLSTLAAESDRLHRLIDNVLDFARLERRRTGTAARPVKVADLLAEVRRTWTDRCGTDGRELVVISTLPPDADVCTDPDLVQQIVGNLIDNARKYSREATDPRIWVWAKPDGGKRVVFEVEDRGPGVSPREQKVIFRPFRRGAGADTTAGGAGLGLALSKQWAEVLGGRLSYRPADGGTGSCFRLELPVK